MIDQQWSLPANMGSAINSANNEIFLTITKTNGVFFASNGHVGLGGLDILEVIEKIKH